MVAGSRFPGWCWVTSSSTGGSGAARGIGYEGRCLAWVAAYMLAERPLPDWACGRKVVAVGGQAERPVDDVAFVTDDGGWVMIQAKAGLKVEERAGSPLGEALGQLVDVMAAGVPRQSPRTDELRAIDPQRDRVLVLTDHRAPATIDQLLAPVTDRLRDLPEVFPLSDVYRSEEQRRAFDRVRGHMDSAWRERFSTEFDEANLRRHGRMLAVRRLHLDAGGQDFEAALSVLAEVISDQDDARRIWGQLEREAQRLAEERSFLDRGGLIRRLENEGIFLRPVARLRADIERLRTRTQANLHLLEEALSLTTPEGASVQLPRVVQQEVLLGSGHTAITGEAGAGKTAVLRKVATSAIDAGTEVVVLRANDLRTTGGATRVELNLDHDLAEVLAGWSGETTGLLLIDGLDQTRGEDTSGWLPELAAVLTGTRWRIVATIRTFDLKHGDRWRELFTLAPASRTAGDVDLTSLRHVLVDDLTDGELAPLRAASPRLASLLDNAGDQLRRLLANPYNLGLAANLLVNSNEYLFTVRSRADLLRRYWRWRVGDSIHNLDLYQTLSVVVDRMVSTGRQVVNPVALPVGVSGFALQTLCSNGVLRRLPTEAGRPTTMLEFSHPVLFDYAVAMLALGDPQEVESLAERLDENPNLSITVRPSFDYRLADAWAADPQRRDFWNLALRLASRTNGHVLAALAAVSVAAREFGAYTDCAQLADACSKTAIDPHGRWDASDAYNLAFLLAATVSRGPADPKKVAVLAEMSAILANRARIADDVELAVLAAQLPRRAAGRSPNEASAEAGTHIVRVAVDCLRLALDDRSDPHRGTLAEVASRLFPDAIVVDASACGALVEQLCAASTIQAWGTRYLWSLVDRIADIARVAPAAAVTIGSSVWEYEETSDEPTSLLDSSILGLTSTRRQDLDSLRYQVGDRFGSLAAVDAVAATELLLRIVDAPRMFKWPERLRYGSPPRPQAGESLRYSGGHDALTVMTDALLSRLVDLAASEDNEGGPQPSTSLARAVSLLITELRHAEVWRRLLLRAARAKSVQLALVLLPAVTSPNLYAHPTTWAAAEKVAARLSPILSPEDHAELEAAILDMVDVATQAYEDDAAYRGYWKEHRNAVICSLSPDKVVSPVMRQLLSDISLTGGAGAALPELSEDALEDIGEIIAVEDSQEGETLGKIRERVHSAREQIRKGEEEERQRAEQELASLWQQVNGLDGAGSLAESAMLQLQELKVDLAEALARVPDAAPDTALGEEVYLTLCTYLPTGAASIAPEAQQAWVDMDIPMWSSTTSSEATTGVAILLLRDDWRSARGDELRDLLRPLLDVPHPIYRFQVTRVLPLLLDEQQDLFAELEQRLSDETDHHVAAELLDHLHRCLRSEPNPISQVFQRLGTLPHWRCVTDDPAGDDIDSSDNRQSKAVRLLTVLAVRYEAPYAREVLTAWLANPLTHPNRASLAITRMRDYLNPADHRLRSTQQRAFQLVTSCSSVLRDTWRAHLLNQENSERQDRLAAVVRIANNIAEQIYFASGAHSSRMTPEETTPRGDQSHYATACLPVLELLASISYPRVTHNLVRTLDHIRLHQPARALRVAAQAVANDPGYAREQLGHEATLRMIKNYLADHRDLVFSNPANTTSLRLLLEAYVRTGWEKAIDLAETMTELFR